jgi:hypothetical protein
MLLPKENEKKFTTDISVSKGRKMAKRKMKKGGKGDKKKGKKAKC